MRVLIAAGFLGRFGETDGAVTTYRQLLPLLAKSGLRADVVAYGPEDGAFEAGALRVFTHRPRVPLRLDTDRRVDLAFPMSSLARELSRTAYTVVQSSTPDPMGLWARGVARRAACPFVAIYHTALAEYASIRASRVAGPRAGRMAGTLAEAWMRRYLNAADLILAPSRSVREELHGSLRPPVAVLGRGVDGDAFHPRRRHRARSGVRPRALYVGRVTPEKNLEWLVPIFKGRTDVELVIVGDGSARKGLERELPDAVFTGTLSGRELAGAYADADFFVFPSLTDTLGNVVLEAMASGLPVVVSNRMGPKDLLRDGATGFVTATREEMGAAVEKLLGDSDLRARMGAAARRFAETRSWAAIFEELVSYYERAESWCKAGGGASIAGAASPFHRFST